MVGRPSCGGDGVILTWADHEGDPVSVESSSIVGISVGSLNGPRAATDTPDLRVTLIWCAGAAQPFMVAAPFAEVMEAWSAARTAGPPPELKGIHGWPVNWWEPHPSTVMPGAPAWGAKGGLR
jgi:hypothetical protein